jgi:predicted outer membrane repeat protein
MDNYYSSPTLIDCTFSGTAATDGSDGGDGGGMHNYPDSRPVLTNVIFIGNTAARDGGGMASGESEPTLTNVTFSGNTAAEHGGGMYNWKSDSMLTNVTFSGNRAVNGGGLANSSSSPTLRNGILWGNSAGSSSQIWNLDSTPTIAYSDVEGSGGSGEGNIDADPLFVDVDGADDVPGTLDDDLRLQSSSPAIDAEDPANCPPTDIRGLPRDDLRCDMGAYEVQLSDASTIEKSGLTGGNTYTFGPTLVQVEVTTLGTLSSLTVERFDQDHPHATEPLKTGKYWTLTPNGGAHDYAVALTLPHDGLADPCVCHYLNPGWDGAWDSRTSTTVTRNDITSLSDWAVSDGAPTAVTLASFSATATDAGAILLAWEMASEVDTLGFRLYRADSPDGGLVPRNEALIPSQSPGSPLGGAYQLVDDAIVPGFSYYYWLDVVDVYDVATRHGPVSAMVEGGALHRLFLPIVNR